MAACAGALGRVRLDIPHPLTRASRFCMSAIWAHASAQSATIKRDSGRRNICETLSLPGSLLLFPLAHHCRLGSRGYLSLSDIWPGSNVPRHYGGAAGLGDPRAPRRRDAGSRWLFTFSLAQIAASLRPASRAAHFRCASRSAAAEQRSWGSARLVYFLY